MKKAIVTVSFGTTYAQAEQTCIRPVEQALAAAYPDWQVRRAYTARIVLRRLWERGEKIDNVAEALERLRQEGFDQVVFASTHVIPGVEYASLCESAGGLPVSEALLSNADDLLWIANLMGRIAAEEGTPVLFMGHGTDHTADEIYVRLREKLPENVYLACVEGAHRLDTILPRLDALPDKVITLVPLMLVAGDHAHNDLAGDEDDSWKSILESRGFRVKVRMRGLGAEPAVQQRFCEKVGKIL